MPLYETVMQEKPPVVMDIGTAYTKIGFAAEPYPRKIIPSNVILSKNCETKYLFDYETEQDLHDQLVDYLQAVFFEYLLVSPKDRKVVIVENVFGPSIIRSTLAKVLFRHFQVSSILFTPSHMISLSTLAIPTAVVIDIGYSETTLVPVYSGVTVMNAFEDQPYGGRMVHQEIKRQLLELGVKEDLLTETVLEDIKVRTCFVTTFARAQQYREGKAPEAAPSVEYPISGEEIVEIPGRLRETVFETMFEESNERDSLPHIILQSILKCPMDMRKELTENIFVIGGSSIIMGLLARLKDELLYLLKNDKEYKEKFCKKTTFKFHKTIGRPNFTAWLGGSLCGGTDLIHSQSLSKEIYIKSEKVPEWVSLADNRFTDYK